MQIQIKYSVKFNHKAVCGSQAETCRQMDRQGPHMQTVYVYCTKCAQ